MSTITLDANTAARFGQCTTSVMVLDSSGRKIGQFLPLIGGLSEEYALAMQSCPHTPAELEAMRQEAIKNPNFGRPLSEIWKSLGCT